MIPTAGLPAGFTLKLIERSREKFETSIQQQPMNKREIDAFRERVSQVQTPEQLVEDFEVYSFVMKAFDLESQIFGKGMMKKLLASAPGDKGALIDRMTDNRFKELHKAMGFTEGGTKNVNTGDPRWIEEMVERYTDQKLINSQLESNTAVGTVLHTRGRAPELTSWYSVLGDTKMQDFFYTALNIPDAMKGADIDAQAAMLSKRLDITTLSDPGVMERLERRYTAIAEAKAAQSNLASNPILQLFAPASQGQRAISQISLDGLSLLKAGRY